MLGNLIPDTLLKLSKAALSEVLPLSKFLNFLGLCKLSSNLSLVPWLDPVLSARHLQYCQQNVEQEWCHHRSQYAWHSHGHGVSAYTNKHFGKIGENTIRIVFFISLKSSRNGLKHQH